MRALIVILGLMLTLGAGCADRPAPRSPTLPPAPQDPQAPMPEFPRPNPPPY